MSRFSTHLHQPNQRVRASDLQRANKLGQQAFLDGVFLRLLIDFAANIPLAEGKAGYFPESLVVTYAGVDRSIGAQFTVSAGLGMKNVGSAETDPDRPKFQPINLEADTTVTAPPSDATNPRIDRIFAKPVIVQDNPQSVDVIDPATKTISQQSLPQDEAWKIELGNGLVYVSGVASATPTPPTAPAGYTDDDAIADILIQPGAGPVLATEITDLRTVFGIHQDMLPSVTSLDADQIVVNPTVMGQSDAQSALQSLESGLVVTEGLLLGHWRYENTQAMRLARIYKDKILIEINGNLLESAGDIIFDLGLHLDTGTEQPSTWYFCYLQDSGGSLIPRISATAPVMDPAVGKVNYHPSQPTWRYVGSFWNDWDGNIAKIKTAPKGRSRQTFFFGIPSTIIEPSNPRGSDHFRQPGNAATSVFVLEPLNTVFPQTIRSALFRWAGTGGSQWSTLAIGGTDLAGLDNNAYGGLYLMQINPGDSFSQTGWVPQERNDFGFAFSIKPAALANWWYYWIGYEEFI